MKAQRQVKTRFSEEVHEVLANLAVSSNRSIAMVVRIAVERQLKEHRIPLEKALGRR